MPHTHAMEEAGRVLVNPYSQRTFLVVGVGGSGVKTIQSFKRVLAHATGVATAGHAGVGARYLYLAIDTDGGELSSSGLDLDERFTLDIERAKRWYDATLAGPPSRVRDQLEAWLPRQTTVSDGRLVVGAPVTMLQLPGAGQRRLVTRMAVHHALDHQGLMDRLETFLKRRATVSEADPQAGYEVHVVFGLAGGTGSGGALHVAAALRQLIGNDPLCHDFVGHAFLDTALTAAQYGVNATRVEANCCAALMELEHFQKLGRQTATKTYLERFEAAGADPAKGQLPLWASSTVTHISRAPFSYVYLYEQTGRQSGVQAYQSAAEALFAATYQGVHQPSASDHANYQLQLSQVYGPKSGLPGSTASYAAHGSAVVHLPREELVRYLSTLVVGDVLERTSPLHLEFARLASDEQGRAELTRLDAERARAATAPRTAPAVRRALIGKCFLASVVELGCSEAREMRGALGTGTNELSIWGSVARTLSLAHPTRTLMGQLVAKMKEVLTSASRGLDAHLAEGLYAQKATFSSVVNKRKNQAAGALREADALVAEFARELSSASFWTSLVGAESDLAASSASAGADLPTVAELCLLYAITACDLNATSPLPATPDEWFAALPHWSHGPSSDVEQSLRALHPDRFPGLFGTGALARLASRAESARAEFEAALKGADEHVRAGTDRINEIQRPKTGLEKWLSKLTADSTDEEVQGEINKLVGELHAMTAQPALEALQWVVVSGLASAVRQAALVRIAGYESYSEAAHAAAQELRKESHALLVPASRGFLHDHEVLTDHNGHQRLWHWYYLDQVADLDIKRQFGGLGGGAPDGGATLDTLGAHIVGFMAAVRSQVAGLSSRELAAALVRRSSHSLKAALEGELEAYLRARLTLERAITLQADYGELSVLSQQAVAGSASGVDVLSSYYDRVRSGRTTRATLHNGRAEALVGSVVARCHDLLSSPLARVSPVAGAPDRPQSGAFAAIAIGTPPTANLDTDDQRRLADDRNQFIALLQSKGAGRLSVVRGHVPLLSPDVFIYYRRNMALIPEWFDEIANDADVLLNELQTGEAGPDLFTARQFTELSVAPDGLTVRRRPLLPFLGLAEQATELHTGREVEAAETRAALLALLLLSRAITVPGKGRDAVLGLRYVRESAHLSRWALEVEWAPGDVEVLQREEPRLATSATDLLAIVRQARRSTAALEGNPRFGLSAEARSALTLFLSAVAALDDALLALQPETVGAHVMRSSLDAGARAALKARVKAELEQRMATKHDPIPGTRAHYPGHYVADIERYAALLEFVLD